MKKILLILTLILVSSLMIGSASAEGFFGMFEDNASDNVNNETNFVVGFNSEFPPFTYKGEDGNYTGFDLELAEEVAHRNNWTFVAQPIIDWNTKEVELNSNEIDCIWSEFTIDGRENDYTWSDPYFNNSQVIIVKNDSGISTPGDLKGKNVEVQEGSSALQCLNEKNESLKNSFAQLTEIREYNTGFMNLESGVCDAVIADVGIADYHLKENFANSNLKILDEPLSYEQYGIGFKKGNDDLKDQVQKTLDEMFKDGTVDEIAEKYEDYNIPEGLIHK
jgi:polar amino acid transport system substrate-binding protein